MALYFICPDNSYSRVKYMFLLIIVMFLNGGNSQIPWGDPEPSSTQPTKNCTGDPASSEQCANLNGICGNHGTCTTECVCARQKCKYAIKCVCDTGFRGKLCDKNATTDKMPVNGHVKTDGTELNAVNWKEPTTNGGSEGKTYGDVSHNKGGSGYFGNEHGENGENGKHDNGDNGNNGHTDNGDNGKHTKLTDTAGSNGTENGDGEINGKQDTGIPDNGKNENGQKKGAPSNNANTPPGVVDPGSESNETRTEEMLIETQEEIMEAIATRKRTQTTNIVGTPAPTTAAPSINTGTPSVTSTYTTPSTIIHSTFKPNIEIPQKLNSKTEGRKATSVSDNQQLGNRLVTMEKPTNQTTSQSPVLTTSSPGDRLVTTGKPIKQTSSQSSLLTTRSHAVKVGLTPPSTNKKSDSASQSTSIKHPVTLPPVEAFTSSESTEELKNSKQNKKIIIEGAGSSAVLNNLTPAPMQSENTRTISTHYVSKESTSTSTSTPKPNKVINKMLPYEEPSVRHSSTTRAPQVLPKPSTKSTQRKPDVKVIATKPLETHPTHNATNGTVNKQPRGLDSADKRTVAKSESRHEADVKKKPTTTASDSEASRKGKARSVMEATAMKNQTEDVVKGKSDRSSPKVNLEDKEPVVKKQTKVKTIESASSGSEETKSLKDGKNKMGNKEDGGVGNIKQPAVKSSDQSQLHVKLKDSSDSSLPGISISKQTKGESNEIRESKDINQTSVSTQSTGRPDHLTNKPIISNVKSKHDGISTSVTKPLTKPLKKKPKALDSKRSGARKKNVTPKSQLTNTIRMVSKPIEATTPSIISSTISHNSNPKGITTKESTIQPPIVPTPPRKDNKNVLFEKVSDQGQASSSLRSTSPSPIPTTLVGQFTLGTTQSSTLKHVDSIFYGSEFKSKTKPQLESGAQEKNGLLVEDLLKHQVSSEVKKKAVQGKKYAEESSKTTSFHISITPIYTIKPQTPSPTTDAPTSTEKIKSKKDRSAFTTTKRLTQKAVGDPEKHKDKLVPVTNKSTEGIAKRIAPITISTTPLSIVTTHLRLSSVNNQKTSKTNKQQNKAKEAKLPEGRTDSSTDTNNLPEQLPTPIPDKSEEVVSVIETIPYSKKSRAKPNSVVHSLNVKNNKNITEQTTSASHESDITAETVSLNITTPEKVKSDSPIDNEQNSGQTDASAGFVHPFLNFINMIRDQKFMSSLTSSIAAKQNNSNDQASATSDSNEPNSKGILTTSNFKQVKDKGAKLTSSSKSKDIKIKTLSEPTTSNSTKEIKIKTKATISESFETKQIKDEKIVKANNQGSQQAITKAETSTVEILTSTATTTDPKSTKNSMTKPTSGTEAFTSTAKQSTLNTDDGDYN